MVPGIRKVFLCHIEHERLHIKRLLGSSHDERACAKLMERLAFVGSKDEFQRQCKGHIGLYGMCVCPRNYYLGACGVAYRAIYGLVLVTKSTSTIRLMSV